MCVYIYIYIYPPDPLVGAWGCETSSTRVQSPDPESIVVQGFKISARGVGPKNRRNEPRGTGVPNFGPPIKASLGPMLASKSPTWSPDGLTWPPDFQNWANMTPQTPNLEPTWPQDAPTWLQLGPSEPSPKCQKCDTYYTFGTFSKSKLLQHKLM